MSALSKRESHADYAAFLHGRGWGYNRIARELGTSATTVRRWLIPGLEEQMYVAARERKRRLTGVCERCDGVTRYNGHGGNVVSRVCAACQQELNRASKVWTREAVVDAIQRFAAAHGRPPLAEEWVRVAPAHHYPARNSVYRSTSRSSSPFPSWSDAIEAAGFPRRQLGVYERTPENLAPLREAQRKRRRFDHERTVRLFRAGATRSELAVLFGVSHSSIKQVIAQAGAEDPAPLQEGGGESDAR